MIPWARGFMTGTRSLSAMVLAVLAGLPLLIAEPMRAEEPNAEAQKAATEWLALIDAGKLEDSWTQAHTLFKEKLAKENWVAMVTDLSSRLGKLKSRKLRVAQPTKSLPGAPEGEYVVFVFDSFYENLPDAVDTLVTAKDKDGSWRVTGYSVQPASKN